MKKVNISIDGINLTVPENYTVLEVAREAGIDIPTLCFLEEISELGCCRMCLVEIEGIKSLQASCVYPVKDGMKIKTHSSRLMNVRKTNLELILSHHKARCQTCVRSSMDCELQTLAHNLGVDDVQFEPSEEHYPIDKGVSIVRDYTKCILCRRCVSVCKEMQTVGVIDLVNRGINTVVAPPFGMQLEDTPCVNCGQCINYCPVGALNERDDTDKVWDAIYDETKHVVVQTAPAVRAALGEEFGMPIGTPVTGKMVAALKLLGFDRVFDTDTAADLTVMEEVTELIDRIRSRGSLPLITSCSPGWIKFCEHNYPEFLDNLSTCKSPHMMFGAIIKSYYAEMMNISPEDIVVVSVMPCTAKKYEAVRPEMEADGIRDVDIVITTRELARMIKNKGIRFNSLHNEEFDTPFGEATGGGHIFGATGGVTEAALRTAADILSGKSTDAFEYEELRGADSIKILECRIGSITLRAGVAHGLSNARKLLDKVKSGELDLQFIEIMACPGGCVNGGGQPLQSSHIRNWQNVGETRAKALYTEDRKSFIRKSHNNPAVKALYKNYLGMAGGTMAHRLLHTEYAEREGYILD